MGGYSRHAKKGVTFSVTELNGKRVLLGVSGGVSAYKAVEVLRLLTKAGACVDVMMTPNAVRFVAPLTFRGLSGRPVIVDLYDLPADVPLEGGTMPHLEIAENIDVAIVAPATANTLARLAHGLADNALVTTLLSVTAPVVVAPAMDSDMWRHPATQANVQSLKARGVLFVGPEVGELARRNVGPGRLSDPETIVSAAARAASIAQGETPALRGRTVLVTAGGTREPLDPVRFLGNRSSGKMGFAIAERAVACGASVTLVSGPSSLTPPAGCDVVRVTTALEMKEVVDARADASDVVIMAAAVADYRPERQEAQKVKKSRDEWEIRLVRNPDIASGVGARKRPGQILVAFAAETEDLLAHASAKLTSKNADLVVANDVSKEGLGFDSDTNEVTLLFRDGTREVHPTLPKSLVAAILLDRIASMLGSTHGHR